MQRAYDRVAAVPQTHGRARPEAGRPAVARRRGAAAVHGEDRFARHVSVRPVCQPDEGHCAPARLQRHDRQTDRRRLHAGGYRGLDERHAAQLCRVRPARAATSSKTPTATACSPAAWARITAPKRSAPPSFPISGGNTERQFMVMKDFGVTAICCTPSYFLHLIDQRREVGHGHQGAAACAPACSARNRGPKPCASASRPTAASRRTTSTACRRSSARASPWNASARPARTFSKTISIRRSSTPRPEPLPDGEEGELVLTTLCKHAMPMIRYRTRDITSLAAEPLRLRPHAAPHPPHRPPQRRHVHHSRRERLSVANRSGAVAGRRHPAPLPDHPDREKGLDDMEVQVEVTPEVFSDTVGALEELQRKLGPFHREHSSACGPPCGWSRRARSSAAKAKPNASSTNAKCNDEAPMKINQLSVFLENKPGASADPSGCWPRPASTSSRSRWPTRPVRHPAADRAGLGEGQGLLEKAGCVVKVTDVVAVEVRTGPAAWRRSWTCWKGGHQRGFHVRVHRKAKGKACLFSASTNPTAPPASWRKKVLTWLTAATA